MNGVPMSVAIALSLLTAALSKPPFDSFICSFSETPSLHLVNQPTLREKVSFVQHMDWGMNTNMQVKCYHIYCFQVFHFIYLRSCVLYTGRFRFDSATCHLNQIAPRRYGQDAVHFL